MKDPLNDLTWEHNRHYINHSIHNVPYYYLLRAFCDDVLMYQKTKTPVLGLAPAIADVAEFHQTFNHPIATKPCIPPPERQVLRSSLIREEYQEFQEAWHKAATYASARKRGEAVHPDDEAILIADIADALADLVYVINGCALEYGIPLHLVWLAVQQANMAKVHWLLPDEAVAVGDKAHLSYKLVLPQRDDGRAGYVCYNQSGKVVKPLKWEAHDIEAIIRKAMEG